MERRGFIIAGTSSGAGKTTATLGILNALRDKNVQAFKVGPDFIDPSHHRGITGEPSYNLDPFLLSEETILSSFYSKNFDIAAVEGVMGLFDGLGKNFYGSTAHVAKILDCPVVIVIDAGGLSYSAAAIIHGFKTLDEAINLRGVIFNKIGGEKHLKMLKDAAKAVDVEVIGAIPRKKNFAFPERHLGLVTPEERGFDPDVLNKISEFIDIDKLYDISDLPTKEYQPIKIKKIVSNLKIGIAMDEAFSFYYQDNLNILEKMGATLIFFSPMRDEMPDVDGLYFGGGYPELFSRELEENEGVRQQIKKSAIPIYAECGGMLYLLKYIDSKEMCGIFDAKAELLDGMQALGYTITKTIKETIIAPKGYLIKGHEFHYSKVSAKERDFAYEMIRGWGISGGKDAFTRRNVLASYMHIHALSDPSLFERFLLKCKES
ncbi:MAG: cobyrinic acid a,c-diamide synthase [Candidatus Methanolliviera sp. GoM_oil]|nr:MAG: cobyrinic acid a,c-diamide synthase [Candidatus Methanolliviera sp. GoM_oil]